MAAAKINAAELSARTRPTPDAPPGIERSTITSYLNNRRRPTGEKLVILARALGVDAEKLGAPKDFPYETVGAMTSSELQTMSDGERFTLAKAEGARQVFDAYEWPPGTTTAVVAQISSALAKEAFQHRGTYIPPSHWKRRIDEELAAFKSKRIEPAEVEADEDASPELREFKAKKRKRR